MPGRMSLSPATADGDPASAAAATSSGDEESLQPGAAIEPPAGLASTPGKGGSSLTSPGHLSFKMAARVATTPALFKPVLQGDEILF